MLVDNLLFVPDLLAGPQDHIWDCWPWFFVYQRKRSAGMAFYVKMSTAPGECAKEAMRQGLGVSFAVLLGYVVPKHDPSRRTVLHTVLNASLVTHMPGNLEHFIVACLLSLFPHVCLVHEDSQHANHLLAIINSLCLDCCRFASCGGKGMAAELEVGSHHSCCGHLPSHWQSCQSFRRALCWHHSRYCTQCLIVSLCL